MKTVILKQIVIVNGRESILSTSDWSESIAEREEFNQETYTDEDIVDLIKADLTKFWPGYGMGGQVGVKIKPRLINTGEK